MTQVTTPLGAGAYTPVWMDRLTTIRNFWGFATTPTTWGEVRADLNVIALASVANQIAANTENEASFRAKINAFHNDPEQVMESLMVGRPGSFPAPIIPGLNVFQDIALTTPALVVNDPVAAVTHPLRPTEIIAQQTVSGNRPPLGRVPKTGLRNRIIGSAAPATQNVSVQNTQHTLSFQGTGTITLSGASTAGPLVGTGPTNIVSLTFTPSSGVLTLTVSGTVELAQLNTGASRGAYQSRPIANDVTEAGQPDLWGLYFDGVSATRHLVSPATINLTGSDKAIFGGSLTKMSDATLAPPFGHGNAASSVGSLGIWAPRTTNETTISSQVWSTAGSTATSGKIITNVAAPISAAIVSSIDFAQAATFEVTILKNNVVPTLSNLAPTQDNIGTHGNQSVFIGSRSGSSFPFNGLTHTLPVLRGGAFTAAELSLISQYLMYYTPGV